MECLEIVSIADAVCRSANKRTIFLRINSEGVYFVQYDPCVIYGFRTFINRNLKRHCVVGIHCQKKPAIRSECVWTNMFMFCPVLWSEIERMIKHFTVRRFQSGKINCFALAGIACCVGNGKCQIVGSVCRKSVQHDCLIWAVGFHLFLQFSKSIITCQSNDGAAWIICHINHNFSRLVCYALCHWIYAPFRSLSVCGNRIVWRSYLICCKNLCPGKSPFLCRK